MPRRVLQGTVASDKGDKTVLVTVQRRVMHPLVGLITAMRWSAGGPAAGEQPAEDDTATGRASRRR